MLTVFVVDCRFYLQVCFVIYSWKFILLIKIMTAELFHIFPDCWLYGFYFPEDKMKKKSLGESSRQALGKADSRMRKKNGVRARKLTVFLIRNIS